MFSWCKLDVLINGQSWVSEKVGVCVYFGVGRGMCVFKFQRKFFETFFKSILAMNVPTL